MIVVEQEGHYTLITQPDHARLAGEILSLWRCDGLPEHPRRERLLFAAREHDNGWQETDAAPYLDSSGRKPKDFLATSPAVRFEVWDRGTARYEGERPYEALLITQHGLTLNRDYPQPDEGWETFCRRLEERRSRLLERTGLVEDELMADYAWINLTDLLSLVACNRWPRSFERHGYTARFEDSCLYLDPFPLAGATTFRIPSRRIEARPYAGDADLGTALAAAPWEQVAIRILRP